MARFQESWEAAVGKVLGSLAKRNEERYRQVRSCSKDYRTLAEKFVWLLRNSVERRFLNRFPHTLVLEKHINILPTNKLTTLLQENNLERSTFRERMFDCLKVRDPFEPVVPQHLEIDNYFTAPFKFERKEK